MNAASTYSQIKVRSMYGRCKARLKAPAKNRIKAKIVLPADTKSDMPADKKSFNCGIMRRIIVEFMRRAISRLDIFKYARSPVQEPLRSGHEQLRSTDEQQRSMQG